MQGIRALAASAAIFVSPAAVEAQEFTIFDRAIDEWQPPLEEVIGPVGEARGPGFSISRESYLTRDMLEPDAAEFYDEMNAAFDDRAYSRFDVRRRTIDPLQTEFNYSMNRDISCGRPREDCPAWLVDAIPGLRFFGIEQVFGEPIYLRIRLNTERPFGDEGARAFIEENFPFAEVVNPFEVCDNGSCRSRIVDTGGRYILVRHPVNFHGIDTYWYFSLGYLNNSTSGSYPAVLTIALPEDAVWEFFQQNASHGVREFYNNRFLPGSEEYRAAVAADNNQRPF